MISRRQLLKTGLAGSALLLAAGFWARPESDASGASDTQGLDTRFLNASDTNLLAAIAPVMLGLSLDANQSKALLFGVDAAITGLPLMLQAEVRQLLDLLGNRWGRRYLAGVKAPWASASVAELHAFLDSWRQSRFNLLRSGYQALHGLVNAAWYANPASFAALSYGVPAQGRILQ
ncbi:hypothetical protein EGI20_11405 [Aquitalea sp. S1-19]|nr:hypothetical protein [Aquitalea sp. S1-19]